MSNPIANCKLANFFKKNVLLFRSIKINTCKNNGLNKIVFTSTAAAYGNPSSNFPIKESAELKPINPYGESKVKTENYLMDGINEKINYIILRYFNVAGADPHMRSGLISKNATHLIKIASEAAIGKREKVIIFGDLFEPTSMQKRIKRNMQEMQRKILGKP